jgi:N-acetylglucosaminyldiphosphoundecaprenol N-acetyl-beta-D-mannosaminyltransferase
MSTASSRAEVLGYAVDRVGLEETVERCRVLIAEAEHSHQVSLNAAKVVRARSDERLAEILRGADLLNADGQSIVWAARLLGDPLPERVAGIDLMFRLLEVAESERLGVFFLGGREAVLAKAVENVRASHPDLRIGGFHHGYFSDSASPDICEAVNRAEVAILFIAMSSPRKEYWAREYRDLLDVPLVMGVGGAVDILAGSVSRAPAWMQRAGLEWFFRLVQEPGRLGPRYFVTNVHFLGLVFKALVQRVLPRLRPRSGAPPDLHPKKAPLR